MVTMKDGFKLDIALSHPARDTAAFTKALLIEPEFVRMKGASLEKQVANSTRWHACLAEGAGEDAFASGSEQVALFLEKNATFWPDFISEGGEVELIFNHTVHPQDHEGDKCFELYLAPAFLSIVSHVSNRGIGLRVQGWQGTSKSAGSAGR
jgi:hypothetical protein